MPFSLQDFKVIEKRWPLTVLVGFLGEKHFLISGEVDKLMIVKILFLIPFLFLFFPITLLAQGSLRAFTTDYCTNFPEGTITHPDLWKDCCLEHDLFFWAGGSREDRNQADLDLKFCVSQSGAPHIAKIMYWGIRLGYYSPIKYEDKKWGNGWKGRESLKALSLEEIDAVDDEINHAYLEIPREIKNKFIQKLFSRLD